MSPLALAELPEDWDEIIENLVTEDDEPVDNLISEKQMRLLVAVLYSSWKPCQEEPPHEPRVFYAAANVGIFSSVREPPIVPDMFLSMDIAPIEEWDQKKSLSYFMWEYGKGPEVAVEIISNKVGHELDQKMRRYALLGVSYYVVFDPLEKLLPERLRVYELGFGGRRYHLRRDFNLPDVGLRLTLWRGWFENLDYEWLRWCDAEGNLIPLGEERAEMAEQRADVAEQRADVAEQRAETEARARYVAEQRAALLAEKLRGLGIEMP